MYFAIAVWAYIISSPWNTVFPRPGIADKRMAGIAPSLRLKAADFALFAVVNDHFIPPCGVLVVVSHYSTRRVLDR